MDLSFNGGSSSNKKTPAQLFAEQLAAAVGANPFEQPNEHNVATYRDAAGYEVAEALSALLNSFVFSRVFRRDTVKVGVVDEFMMTSGATHLTAAAITEELQRLALTGKLGVKATLVDPARVHMLGSRMVGVCLDGVVSHTRRLLFERALALVEQRHLRGIICRVRFSLRDGDALPEGAMLFPLFPARIDIRVKRFWNRAAWGVRSGLVYQIGEVRKGVHRKAKATASAEALTQQQLISSPRGNSSSGGAAAAAAAASLVQEAAGDKGKDGAGAGGDKRKAAKRPFCSTNEYYVAVTQEGLPISRVWIGAAPTIFVFWATWDEPSCKFMRDWYAAWGHADAFFHGMSATAAPATSSSSSPSPAATQRQLQHDPWLIWCARWLDPSDLDGHAVTSAPPPLGGDEASIAKHMQRFMQRAGFLLGELQQAGRVVRALCQVVFVSCDLDKQAAADFVSNVIRDAHTPRGVDGNGSGAGAATAVLPNGDTEADLLRSKEASDRARNRRRDAEVAEATGGARIHRSSSPSSSSSLPAFGSGGGDGATAPNPARYYADLRRGFGASFVRTSHYWAGPESTSSPLCAQLDIRCFPTLLSATNRGVVHSVHEFSADAGGPVHMARLDAHVLLAAEELAAKRLQRRVQRQQLLQQQQQQQQHPGASSLSSPAGRQQSPTRGFGGSMGASMTMLDASTTRKGAPQTLEQLLAMDASLRRNGDFDASLRLLGEASFNNLNGTSTQNSSSDAQQQFLAQLMQLQQSPAQEQQHQHQQQSRTTSPGRSRSVAVAAGHGGTVVATPPQQQQQQQPSLGNYSFWHSRLTPAAREHILNQLRVQLDLFDTPVTLETEHRWRLFSSSRQLRDRALLGRVLVMTDQEREHGVAWQSKARADVRVRLPDEFKPLAEETSLVSLRGTLTLFQFERIAPLLQLLWMHFAAEDSERRSSTTTTRGPSGAATLAEMPAGDAGAAERMRLRDRSILYHTEDEGGEVLREGLRVELDCVMCCPRWVPWHANISVFNAVSTSSSSSSSSAAGARKQSAAPVTSSLARNEILCCHCRRPVVFAEAAHFQCLHCVQLKTGGLGVAPRRPPATDNNNSNKNGGAQQQPTEENDDAPLPPTVLCWGCGLSHHNTAHVLMWLPAGDEYNEALCTVWGPGNVSPLPRLRNGDAALSTTGVHAGIYCDSCRATVKGVRWKCAVCYDIDLCDACFNEHVVDAPKWGAADGGGTAARTQHRAAQQRAQRQLEAQRAKEQRDGGGVSFEEMPSIHGGDSRDGRRRLCHFSHVFLRIASPALSGSDSGFILPEVRRVTIDAGLKAL